MKLKFAGILRKTEFSPNHIENDLLIISRTADHLRRFGADVVLMDEAKLSNRAPREEFVFSMAQGPTGNKILAEIENKKHPLIINSPGAVVACYRYNMVKRLPCGGIPFPKSFIIDTAQADATLVEELKTRKIWVKRGDVHAVHKEDVTVAYNLNEAMTIIREFDKRGIKLAVLQENVDGDTVKFYGVRDSSFFHWYYLNGIYHTPFDNEELKRLALRSAEVLKLWIYGGDAVIGKDGSITIIDINDWPSFAPVREEASQAIANLIYNKAREKRDVGSQSEEIVYAN